MGLFSMTMARTPRCKRQRPRTRPEIPAPTIAAMHLAGADEIYLLGGVQAVAALGFRLLSATAVDRSYHVLEAAVADLPADPG